MSHETLAKSNVWLLHIRATAGSYQERLSQAAPGSAAGVGSQVLGAAGLAGNFQVGEPHPSAEGAGGAAPGLEPRVGGPQRQESWGLGQGGGLLASHLQLVVESLQQPAVVRL